LREAIFFNRKKETMKVSCFLHAFALGARFILWAGRYLGRWEEKTEKI